MKGVCKMILDWILSLGLGLLILIVWATGSSTEQIKRKRNALIKYNYDKRFKNKK